jgi:hypothetical protein
VDTAKALEKLENTPRLKMLPHLIGTGMPWADKHDYGNRVSEEQRQNATVEKVPISKLHALQPGVNPHRVAGIIRNPECISVAGRKNKNGYTIDMPIVVDYDGKLYLHDGHHQIGRAHV